MNTMLAGALITVAACAPASDAAPAASTPETPVTQEQQDRRIDYIEIPVRDVARAKAFYQEAFGWEFTDYGPDYTSFMDGRMAGGLRGGTEPPAKGVLVVIYALDLDQVRARVEAAGGTVVTEPFSFPGGRRFHFADPSGNELAVWTDR